MTEFRVPIPVEPERRQAAFDRAADIWLRHGGSYEGGPDACTFDGRTSVGRFRGTFESTPGSSELTVRFEEKPWLIPSGVIAHFLRNALKEA
jgi:hypothetical protein